MKRLQITKDFTDSPLRFIATLPAAAQSYQHNSIISKVKQIILTILLTFPSYYSSHVTHVYIFICLGNRPAESWSLLNYYLPEFE